jgi:drug/metabolite transporter (DMT)-like permease
MNRITVVIVVTLFLWASAFVGIRVAIEHYSPGALALFRFLVASLLLTSYMVASGRGASLRRATRSDWLGFAALGLTGVFIYHVALNAGERTVSAGAASLLVNTTPVFTVLLAAMFLKDRLSRRGALGMAIAFAGAALVSIGANGGLRLEMGAIFVLVAAVSQAVYFIVQKDMLERYGALELTTASTVCGFLMLSMFTPELIDAVTTAPRSASLVALYLGIGPSAGAYLGWAHIVSKLPVSRAVTLLYLVPVLAYLLGWALLGETPSLLSVLGGIATIAGVALVHRRSR